MNQQIAVKIKLVPDCFMGKNFSFGQYTKENRLFLQNAGTATFENAVRSSMNYYRLANGFFVHIYCAKEVH